MEKSNSKIDQPSPEVPEIPESKNRRLLKELFSTSGISSVTIRSDGVRAEEIKDYAEALAKISPQSAAAFLKVSPFICNKLNHKEFGSWVTNAEKILNQCAEGDFLCESFFTVGQEFVSSETIGLLGGWVDQILQISQVSISVADGFLRIIPHLLKHGKLFHIREWADRVLQIFNYFETGEEIVLPYLKTGAEFQKFLTFRELQIWNTTGFNLLNKSSSVALKYFSEVPEKINSLYRIEIRKLFELTDRIGRILPGNAVDFYKKAPSQLYALNPNVREIVLDLLHKKSRQQAEDIYDLFDAIIKALSPLPYPLQDTVIKSEIQIAALSNKASKAYLMNVGKFLEEVHESFLLHWVEKGCRFTAGCEQWGIDYFSFNTPESRDELDRWKEAVFFHEQKNTLTIFSRALCGRELQLKCTDPSFQESSFDISQYPKNEGQNIFLPPFMAEEPTQRLNFLIYKTATAHQAGYFEFGTFGPKFTTIKTILNSLDHKDLALDIFFILEDGRIDFNLRMEYAGLCQDLNTVQKSIMDRREYPLGNPLLEAMEILLRLTIGYSDSHPASPMLIEYARHLKQKMKGFYEKAESVWDSLTKTLEIYHLVNAMIKNLPYHPLSPLPYRDLPDFEQIPGKGFSEEIPDELVAGEEGASENSPQFSEEELERLIDLFKDMKVTEPLANGTADQGMFISNLDGVMSLDSEVEFDTVGDAKQKASNLPTRIQSADKRGPFFYDEWDYLQKGYRRKWCCLHEKEVVDPGPELFNKIAENYSCLIKQVKAQFQRIRPEVLENVKRVEWGDEIDFNAMLESVVERKIGDSPSDRIFARREKKIRRISTLLLVDMSASTDRLASSITDVAGANHNESAEFLLNVDAVSKMERKILDIEMESMVVMTEALEALDDDYAIYGFSGYGREQIDFFCIKEFDDRYSEEIKGRICGIQAQKSTRMGPAIRHATAKLRTMDSDHRLLIMLSDGYPQDLNYGEDRTSQEYALHDTMMALIEAKRAEIKPFCITVDQCGDDYLRKMCDPRSYLVIKNIYSLPTVLPKVVESLIG